MKKVRITNCDADLCGTWAMSTKYDREQDLQDLLNGDTTKSVWIVKLKSNGELSKKEQSFPFKSYASNRAIAIDFMRRNANAKIELIGDMETETLGGVATKCGDEIVFELDGKQYTAKARSYHIEATVWLDDESETYYNLRDGKISEEAKKNLFIAHQYYEIDLICKETGKRVNNDFEEFNIEHCFADIEKARKIKAIIDAENAKEAEKIGKYYDRFKDKVSFRGYWANR